MSCRAFFLVLIYYWYNKIMDIDYNEKDWATPCPKYDCKKTACKCGLEYVNIPASLGDDNEDSKVAPKNGAYCNALVVYKANGHVYIYSKEGVPTLIDVDASDISTLEQEVRKAQKDVHELREDIDGVIYGFDTVADMKLATNLINGSYAQTLGYYTINDDGSAKYMIRTKEIDDTPDEMLLIAIGDNLVAELVTNGKINTAQCGVIGDGVTNVTSKLNTFFSLDNSLNKIVSPGTYLIDNTLYIGGIWRQDSGNNGQKSIIFDHATIKYSGTADGYSVVLYNMFKYKIDGLCITRDSVFNKLGVIGVWYGDFSNFDVQSIDITTDTSILNGRTVSSASSEYINFSNVYVKGQLSISPVSPSYINCINFYNSIIDGSNRNYCVMLYGTTSKQEINFYNTDISYATSAVFYVDSVQDVQGKGSINCIGCYFDSNIPIFYGDDKKNMEFNSIFGLFPALSNNEIVNVKYTEFIKNLNLCGFGQFGYNLPFSNINYCINGDLSYQTNQSENANYLMGANSAVWTKTYETSLLATNGKCRHLKWLGSSENATIVAECVTAPRTDIYSCYVRIKITAGSCTGIQLAFGGSYVTVDSSKISGESLLVNSKNVQISENGSLNFSIIFMGASSDLEADVYEAGVTEGKLIVPNMPLDSRAKLS